MTAEPAPRVSPWWMAAPALLFIANFVAAALTSASSTKNAVYSASAIIGTIAVDLVLIGYVLFAVRMSRRPIRPMSCGGAAGASTSRASSTDRSSTPASGGG